MQHLPSIAVNDHTVFVRHSNSDEPEDAADESADHEQLADARQDDCEGDGSDGASDDEVGGTCSLVPHGI